MMQRSRALLEGWLEEFAELVPDGAPARIATQEEIDGRDGGLIITPLRNATTSVYLQQVPSSPHWTVTIEEQPEVTELSSRALVDLADELIAVAELCTFLEHKSRQLAAAPD